MQVERDIPCERETESKMETETENEADLRGRKRVFVWK